MSEVQEVSADTEKFCPNCLTTKSVLDFYPRRTRATPQFSSWCKKCTNKTRSSYKSSPRSRDCVVVAKVTQTIGKPSTCPCCGEVNVPAHRMRGRVTTDGIAWSCYACRTKAISEERKAKVIVITRTRRHYCDWCCEPMVGSARFCGKTCTWGWMMARAAARAAGRVDAELAYLAVNELVEGFSSGEP